MKAMILGAHGMLGNDLMRELEGHCELDPRDLHDFDICDEQRVMREIEGARPDVVVNCAAYTNVDGCETEKKTAFAVNGEAPGYVARACRRSGSLLYHISTDFIFDGNKNEPYVETDIPGPLSVYGRSKLEGERAVQAGLPDHVIIRTSWLFGRGGKNFVSTIQRLSEEKDEIRVVNDQFGCPTYTVDLAKAIRCLMDVPARGIFHACNTGACTWYEFAKQIIACSGHRTRVVPIGSHELSRPAVRPAYSVMNCSRLEAAVRFRFQPWGAALRQYLDEQPRS